MIRITLRCGRALGIALAVSSAACATTSTRPPAATEAKPQAAPPAATATTPAGTAPSTSPTAGDAKSILRAAIAEVDKGHLTQARALLDQARPLVAGNRDLEFRAADAAIAIFTNLGDYESAARAILDAIRQRSGDPPDERLFMLHNWMAIMREAEGDLPGAIVACAERTAVGYEGTWEPAAERLKLTRFKDDWHRAYLFRMYAEQLSGSHRDAALLAAENARKDYVAAGGYPDSIAVLDALFAMYDHRWDDVRAAVKRVNIAKDDDEEDLYLLFTALDSTGDHDAAAPIRRQIEKNPPYWGVWRAWLKSDTDGSPPAQKRFSPRYPTGKRP